MTYRTGDWIIYRKSKRSPNPGPRAEQIQPSGGGEGYSYIVEKYWVVKEVQGDNQLVLITRRGKTHVVSTDDPSIRKANWWQRFRHRQRFEEVVADH
jgi:hypothetical protein